MIEVHDLTKVYGSKMAVNHVTFTVQSGKVTGFLGPNGAGKSTTMRCVMGLDHPTSGTSTINGKQYADIHAPLREVGALLDAKAAHPGRSARTHLRAMAATEGISRKRVDEVIGLAGLDSVADKNVGGFSLGMGQRLGVAAALLGDPETLILDEPVNGLDPEGVLWVRNLVKYLARTEGRTVFLSSHLMSEMELTADNLIILGQGRILQDISLESFIEQSSGITTRVRSTSASQIIAHFNVPNSSVKTLEPGLVQIDGVKASDIGEAAAQNGWVLHELTPVEMSLESAYMRLTAGAQEYSSSIAPNTPLVNPTPIPVQAPVEGGQQ